MGRQRHLAVITIMLGIALSVLDTTTIALGLPTMARDLGVSADLSIWIVNGFQLAALVALYLCWQGCKGVLRTWSNESVTLPVSDAVLYAALPLAMAWWAYRLIRRLRNPLA